MAPLARRLFPTVDTLVYHKYNSYVK